MPVLFPPSPRPFPPNGTRPTINSYLKDMQRIVCSHWHKLCFNTESSFQYEGLFGSEPRVKFLFWSWNAHAHSKSPVVDGVVVPFPQNHFGRLVVKRKDLHAQTLQRSEKTVTMYSGVPSVVKVRAGTYGFRSKGGFVRKIPEFGLAPPPPCTSWSRRVWSVLWRWWRHYLVSSPCVFIITCSKQITYSQQPWRTETLTHVNTKYSHMHVRKKTFAISNLLKIVSHMHKKSPNPCYKYMFTHAKKHKCAHRYTSLQECR